MPLILWFLLDAVKSDLNAWLLVRLSLPAIWWQRNLPGGQSPGAKDTATLSEC